MWSVREPAAWRSLAPVPKPLRQRLPLEPGVPVAKKDGPWRLAAFVCLRARGPAGPPLEACAPRLTDDVRLAQAAAPPEPAALEPRPQDRRHGSQENSPAWRHAEHWTNSADAGSWLVRPPGGLWPIRQGSGGRPNIQPETIPPVIFLRSGRPALSGDPLAAAPGPVGRARRSRVAGRSPQVPAALPMRQSRPASPNSANSCSRRRCRSSRATPPARHERQKGIPTAYVANVAHFRTMLPEWQFGNPPHDIAFLVCVQSGIRKRRRRSDMRISVSEHQRCGWYHRIAAAARLWSNYAHFGDAARRDGSVMNGGGRGTVASSRSDTIHSHRQPARGGRRRYAT